MPRLPPVITTVLPATENRSLIFRLMASSDRFAGRTGALDAAVVTGYRAAGGVAGLAGELSDSQRARLTLYRLWAMTVQAIEIVPRGFSGDWVTGHRDRIARNRGALFAQLGV